MSSRYSRALIAALVLVATLVVAFRVAPAGRVAPGASPRSVASSAAGSDTPAATPSGQTPGARTPEQTPELAALAYGAGWRGTQPPELAAFRAWAERYVAAPSEPARLGLRAEGVALARARRPVLHALIVADPREALALTVPMAVRAALPAAVLAELETRHAGRGDYALLAAAPAPGESLAGPALQRVVTLGGVTWTAHVYGRREAQLTKEGASLHGIALDGAMALHESPLRVLEPGESAEPAAVCRGCGELLAEGPGASDAAVLRVELDGAAFPIHGADLAGLAARAAAAEAGDGPRVRPLSAIGAAESGGLAGEPAPPHAVGVKQVLVIRADFSDFPGEPLTQAAAQTVLDGAVNPHLIESSYGLTSLVTTVTPRLYRLPRTGASYATANDRTALHADARAAAAADHTLGDFDRVIVLFPNIGTSRVPGSQITFAGLASVAGTNAWINGPASFALPTVTHELGHTYGLLHANLWRVTDRNPISAGGNTTEYGDPFDMMGSTSVTGVTRDTRHHFGPWSKNRLGWLPDDAVTTVAASGTYRIHRFDHRNAPRDRPLGLRIFRDGVRWYWVGLRQSFSAGALRSDGAYVTWGFNQRLQSQLLDLTTPGTTATDAALPLGTAFTDAIAGVTIKPLARGGTDPEQWLDVEVTLADRPPNMVVAWGREGATFYDTESGEDLVPAPETNVAMDLTGVIALAAGDQHALALKADGTVVAWGNGANGQIAVPAAVRSAVAIAAGGHVSGAVLADGTVRLWGDATSGILTPPAGLGDVRQLAIGGGSAGRIYHALALKNDGTVVGWGDNTRNQATPPANLGPVAAIAASDRLSVALRADGSVVRFGTTFTGAIAFPTGLADVTAIASSGGAVHALALKRDGTVVAWGVNSSGQADVPAGLTGVVALATGGSHSLALKSDGSLVTWGAATSGRGNVPRALPRAYAVAASASASFAVVGHPVQILVHPAAQVAVTGGSATFRVSAAGAGTLSYQWRKDGVAIPGATAASYTLARTAATDRGAYDVVITASGTALTSRPADLSVEAAGTPLVSRISNLSIRTSAGTGANTLIVGFAVGGAGTGGTKPLVVRGIGPTLGLFGVAGTLADPRVELYDRSGTKVLENDNWLAVDAPAFAQVGAFALALGSRDAALVSPGLASASYSAQFSGSGGASGVVLAEIYDATPSEAFTAARPRLVNVSARAASGTGGDVLIAGFVVAGPPGSTKTVLVRGIGPTLTVFGVTGVLADPRLTLFGAGSTVLRENDDWGGGATLKAAFGAVGAFQLVDDAKDAALVATLQPGAYTVQVGAAAGQTGIALVEVYEVP